MNFDQAFDILIDPEHEGKDFSDNPADPGGATRYGCTERVARSRGYVGDMRELPLSFAKAVAKTDYWDKYHCDQFDGAIGFAVFDAAYNGGHPAEWLQQSAGVTVDGVIGAQTIAALRAADPMRIVMRFTALRLYYLSDLKIWPSFSRGWAKRISNNLTLGAK